MPYSRRTSRKALVALLGVVLLCAATPRPAAADLADIHLTIRTPAYTLGAGGLAVPGYATNDAAGAPALPLWTTVVELPEDADWSLTWDAPEERTWATGESLPAVPVPELALDRPMDRISADELPALARLVDRPDEAIYETNAFYPAQAVQAGPLAIQAGRRLLPVRVFPFQHNPVTGELRYRPHIEVTIHLSPRRPASPRAAGVAPAEIDAGAALPGLRIRTGERGLYRLTYAALSDAGVPVAGLDPAGLAMSYLGEPIDIEVTGAGDGRFDAGDMVLFYAEPYAGRYMTQNVYRLTWSGGGGSRMASRDATPSPSGLALTTIRQAARVEVDKAYYSTYDLPRDADHFFDDPLYATSRAASSGRWASRSGMSGSEAPASAGSRSSRS